MQLDRQELIGNAPPPGEPVYSGQTSPGARLPHSSVEAAPINKNIELSFPNGVPVPYYYTEPTTLGFSGGGGSTYDDPNKHRSSRFCSYAPCFRRDCCYTASSQPNLIVHRNSDLLL